MIPPANNIRKDYNGHHPKALIPDYKELISKSNHSAQIQL